MSVSDDIAAQTIALYKITGDPIATAMTFLTPSGIPDSTWDNSDSAGVGRSFSIGSFVQNTSNDILYRCIDATSGAAVWTIVVQENM